MATAAAHDVTSKEVVALLINGKSLETKSKFTVINPQTGNEAWECSSASVEDAAKAVEAAKTAFPAWSKTKPAVRRDIFLKAADLIEARKVALASFMETETGAATPFISFNISTTASQLRDMAGRISGIQGSFPTPDEEGRSALILKEPYGVVLGIAPW
jgi:acyl-CoA reductase-like NAD-dependent aldehyde dehydrogenase